MSGRYLRLDPGRYTLAVPRGAGPAGVHRQDGHEVMLDIHGGRVEFDVDRPEQAYYWWRGPRKRTGVRLLGVAEGGIEARREDQAEQRSGDRPVIPMRDPGTGTTG